MPGIERLHRRYLGKTTDESVTGSRPSERGEPRMAAHAGEKAHKTGDFHCAKCDAKVHVQKRHTIPKCPNGHSEFETRTNEPGNKSS
jgi:hypothetical protein